MKLSRNRIKKRSCAKIVKKRSLKRLSKRSKNFLERIEEDILVCNDTSKCFSFDSTSINNIFKYATFEYCTKIETINKGANGIVSLITYEIDEYLSTAILKRPTDSNSDNLFYEYIAGIEYINNQLKYFPCFVETYCLYDDNIEECDDNTNEISCDDIKNYRIVDISNIDMGDITCIRSCNLNLLIQNIDNAMTLHEYCKIENGWYNIFEMRNILYQIYAVLDVLQNEFTHYDLHTGNVLLYQIPNGQSITMRYHESDGQIIEFKTKFIAKIIDYGRCFYEGEKMYPENASDCGYSFIDDTLLKDAYYISTQIPNKSHDLLLASRINEIDPLVFPYEIIYKDDYGTPPKDTNMSKKTINNVYDLHMNLKNLVTKSLMFYKTVPIIGILNIYLDKSKKMSYKTN